MKGRGPRDDGDPALGVGCGLVISLVVWAVLCFLFGRWWWS